MKSIRKMSVLLFCLVIACSSIKIETGTTTDEVAQKNELQAKQIRGDWAEQLRGAQNDERRAFLVKVHMDSVSSIIFKYGFRVADEWNRGNAGRGVEIKDTEMRQVVDAWVAGQKPILKAYEDNMEYGIKLVRETRTLQVLPEEAHDLFDSLAHQYYESYSIVFYPNHNVEVYEEQLLEAQSRHQYFSDKLGKFFRSY